jgi:hypothetical protein
MAKVSNDDSQTFPLSLRSYGHAEALTQRLLDPWRAWGTAGRPRREHLEIIACPLNDTIDVPEGAVVMPKRWHL